MKKSKTSIQNFILLPASKMAVSNAVSPASTKFLVSLSAHAMDVKPTTIKTIPQKAGKAKNIKMKVIDSIHENGAKLIAMDKTEMANFRFSYPGLRIIPEMFYEKAWTPPFTVTSAKTSGRGSGTSKTIKIKILSSNKNEAIKNVDVVCFTDFKNKKGAQAKTNAQGVATIKTTAAKFERIYIYPQDSYWPWLKKNVKVTPDFSIKIEKIETNYKDALRHFYNVNKPIVNNKIKVAVIDTGVGPHKDINLIGGANTVAGENPADYHDNGENHGTHVAGIIGANGTIKGIAAGVQILSYRVFPVGKKASNFYIMKAIDRAVADGCDLINMSLGQQGGFDEGVVSSIKDAYSNGVICFAATGNDGRLPVSFPASYSLSISVSAMGRKGTYPSSSEAAGTEAKPLGKDPKNFIADFSNIGNDVDLTAPGVGILSTVPVDKYAIMNGTSMACPAATGMAVRLLLQEGKIITMSRNQQRADEMIKFLSNHVQLLGFGTTYEGMGMLKH